MFELYKKCLFAFCMAGLFAMPAVSQELGSRVLADRASTAATFSEASLARSDEQVIFDNGNIYAVQNAPTAPTKFSLTKPYVIASIQNYHWNDAKGSRPGTIALRDSSGRVFGPWPTRGSQGQGGVPNAYWTAMPNIRLGAGEYTVVDSEPATWARNSQSGNRGFTRVTGHAASIPGPVLAVTENRWSQKILIWVSGFAPRSMQDVLNYHLEPGWKGTLKVTIPPSGNLTFVAGEGTASERGGPDHQYDKVLTSCNWHGDPNDTTKVPYIVFQSDKTLTCGTKSK